MTCLKTAAITLVAFILNHFCKVWQNKMNSISLRISFSELSAKWSYKLKLWKVSNNFMNDDNLFDSSKFAFLQTKTQQSKDMKLIQIIKVYQGV
jgi:hypothetical protein